ncbi:MAG: hypothetical protein DME01_03675 [Candidatus Rokuibacteriota bacterium]|nr:MAG: hypothetical protein DME01_03675 [Candidatus Rokubacteria bacterium]
MCRAPLALALGAVIVLTGCAGRRIENGVYHSAKGYRLTLPGADWSVAAESKADLELRHQDGLAAMLANAECDDRARARSAGLLLGQLLIGVHGRATIEQDEVSMNGRQALHRVLDGRVAADGAPTRIEAYVLKDGACVYDFAYAAPPGSFEAWRPDFRRFVESFAKEQAD